MSLPVANRFETIPVNDQVSLLPFVDCPTDEYLAYRWANSEHLIAAGEMGRVRNEEASRRCIEWAKEDMRAGLSIDYAILVNGELAGKTAAAFLPRRHEAEGHYWIGEEHQGQGIVPVATEVLLDRVFCVDPFVSVKYVIRSRNIRSLGAVRKLGATHSATNRVPDGRGDWEEYQFWRVSRG